MRDTDLSVPREAEHVADSGEAPPPDRAVYETQWREGC